MGDAIHKPDHYCFSKYEPRKVIHAWGLNFNLGSAIKYIVRAGRKDDIVQDLEKAREFIAFEIEEIKEARAEAEKPKRAGINISELVGMPIAEFRERFLEESATDAYHYEYVDDSGNRWILSGIEGCKLHFESLVGSKVVGELVITLQGGRKRENN